MALAPFHHQPAVIKQLLGKFYGTLHVTKKGVLPTAPRPVVVVDDDALLEAMLWRAVPDLKHILIRLVPSYSRRKCFQEGIHRSVPDIVRSLLEPGLFQQLYRLFVNRLGSQPLLRFRNPLIHYGAQTFFIVDLGTGRPPETIGPTAGNCL
ncbi:hypothetical protein V1527DRAFT_522028 [Lipomyces starkeyi]